VSGGKQGPIRYTIRGGEESKETAVQNCPAERKKEDCRISVGKNRTAMQAKKRVEESVKTQRQIVSSSRGGGGTRRTSIRSIEPTTLEGGNGEGTVQDQLTERRQIP